jgi:hypothetical protein
MSRGFSLGFLENCALMGQMFSSKQLSDEQKATLHQWADDGATMAEIQKRMNEEWQLRLTYMDTRFLILDLGLTLKTEVKEEPKPAADEEVSSDLPDASLGGGAVQVSRDEIVIPGMLFSGKVIFSDGHRAAWYVDETGRLGLDPQVPGYRPSQEDIMAFQEQLRSMLR